MATLKQLQTGAEVHLAARHVVGRSRACQLSIELANVSALHAELAWDGQAWQVRDLGSRNGTFVAGRRLLPGQPAALALGEALGFGAPENHYRLVDASPPELIAFGVDEIQVAEDGVLWLPSPAACEVMVLCGADGRWVVESPEGTRPIEHEECLVVGARPFHIHLPAGLPVTRRSEEMSEPATDDELFEFRVSRDGEHVDLQLHHGARVLPIESRAHAFLLLALARTRLTDMSQAQLPESEHGWMHREDLMKELAVDDPRLLNVWVYRARQQLAEMKLRGASKIIERREGAGQLRLGAVHVRVIDV
jgi:hypothetical protein